ncbi:caspase-3-like [Oratosquilla oratoria]|uniref:caspase-3-like n=1 Tax=Oratosquilla oratoria TaxID=337810 RepID=UPI003F76C921
MQSLWSPLTVRKGRAYVFFATAAEDSYYQDKDEANLRYILERLNFSIEAMKSDMTSQGIKENLTKVAKKDDFDGSDALAVFLIGHGHVSPTSGEEVIGTKDFKELPMEELWEAFKECRTLVGKPKLFFIMASRGPQRHKAAEVLDSVDSSAPLKKVRASIKLPVFADFVVVYGTTRGHDSYRDNQGQVAVHFLKKAVEEFDFKKDLNHLLTLYNHKMAFEYENPSLASRGEGACQMSQWSSTLTNLVYFATKSS